MELLILFALAFWVALSAHCGWVSLSLIYIFVGWVFDKFSKNKELTDEEKCKYLFEKGWRFGGGLWERYPNAGSCTTTVAYDLQKQSEAKNG